MTFKYEVLPGGIEPVRLHRWDACWDLHACRYQVIEKGCCAVVPLGIRLELMPGWCARILGRSGLAAKGILVHPGMIDAGYRGEICAVLFNAAFDATFDGFFAIASGDRVAQMFIQRIDPVNLTPGIIDRVSDRGEAGFGSTGVGGNQ